MVVGPIVAILLAQCIAVIVPHNRDMTTQPQPVLLFSHGPGPAFFLQGGRFEGVDANSSIVADYRAIASKLPRVPR